VTTDVRTVPGAPPLPATGVYQIDPAHSSIEIVVRHLVVARVRGRFSEFSGEIVVAEKPEDSSVNVEIKTASIDTNQPDRDADLKSANFFDVENHPTATFRSTGLQIKGEGEEFLVDGELTIQGTTRPVQLTAAYGGPVTDPYGNEKIAFHAETEINREEFGMTWNVALETGGVLVGKLAKVEIDIEALRQA